MKNHIAALEKKLNSHISKHQIPQTNQLASLTQDAAITPVPDIYPIPNAETPTTNKETHHQTSHRTNAPIFGTKTANDPGIVGKQKPISLFVGGFSLDLSKEDVSHIITNRIGINVLDISQVKRNRYNQSFKIDIDASDKDKSKSTNTWYQGLIVRPFKQRKVTNPNQDRNHYSQHYNTEYKHNNDRRHYQNRIPFQPTTNNRNLIQNQNRYPLDPHAPNFAHSNRFAGLENEQYEDDNGYDY